jgi:hypothetical protein
MRRRTTPWATSDDTRDAPRRVCMRRSGRLHSSSLKSFSGDSSLVFWSVSLVCVVCAACIEEDT